MSARTWLLTDSETLQLSNMRTKLRRYYGRRVPAAEVEALVTTTIIEAGSRFERRSSLRRFVFGIARRQAASAARSREHGRGQILAREVDLGDEHLVDPAAGIETLMDRGQRRELLDAALAKVPEHYRCVVELCVAGHDSLQIAAALGLNYNTARSRLSRGRAMLLSAYEDLRDKENWPPTR